MRAPTPRPPARGRGEDPPRGAAFAGAPRLRAALAALVLFPALLGAQPPRQPVEVVVVPDCPGWICRAGQPARFAVSVLRAGQPVAGARVRYALGPELMPPRAAGDLPLRRGRTEVDGGTLAQPGFLRLTVTAQVEGREYAGTGTAGFSPEEIRPAGTTPEDFEGYWREAVRQARAVPLNPTLTPLPEQSTAEAAVYHVSFQNERAGSRIFGMLSVPTAPGRYPALLEVPGAGVRPYRANTWIASRGAIHLAIGIHGIPVNLEPRVYEHLSGAALANYWMAGIEDRDRFYYRRVVLGAVRAGDFLATLPQWDGERYGVYGASQGGALSIITAALDERVDALAAIHPALADHEAWLHGRAGGWPHLFRWNPAVDAVPENIRTARYYDVASFARLVRVPGWYSWGVNDDVTPPSSVYAAVNVIAAPREIRLYPEAAHWTYPDQWNGMTDFLLARLKAE